MVWEDYIISVANLLFVYSLVHQVFHGFKTKKSSITLITSGLTWFGLYATGIAFYSLGLYMSAFVITITGTLWLILFFQKLFYG